MSEETKRCKTFQIALIKRDDAYESLLGELQILITESGMKPSDC